MAVSNLVSEAPQIGVPVFKGRPVGPKAMTEPSREEFDAKLATVEARTETRFVELSSKIDRVTDAISAFNTSIKTELDGLKTEMTGVKTDNKSTRTTIIVTVVASVLAGLAAIWITQANLLAALQTGLASKPELTQQPGSTQGQQHR